METQQIVCTLPIIERGYMKSIGLIKSNIYEVTPVLDEIAVALIGCIERLDETGVVIEESNVLKESLRLMNTVQEQLETKKRELANFNSSEQDDE